MNTLKKTVQIELEEDLKPAFIEGDEIFEPPPHFSTTNTYREFGPFLEGESLVEAIQRKKREQAEEGSGSN